MEDSEIDDSEIDDSEIDDSEIVDSEIEDSKIEDSNTKSNASLNIVSASSLNNLILYVIPNTDGLISYDSIILTIWVQHDLR
jgi:hypothetical protein